MADQSHRPKRRSETGHGSAARRNLEFEVLLDQVKRRRAAFTERLKRNLQNVGKCIVARGTLDHNGYPRMNFRFKGKHVTIHTMRVVAIMRTAAPIPRGLDVAHTHPSECPRSCVYHTELQHFSRNRATEWNEIPF